MSMININANLKLRHWLSFKLWVVTQLSAQRVRNINHPLCGCAVFVIQKNHLSVIILDV